MNTIISWLKANKPFAILLVIFIVYLAYQWQRMYYFGLSNRPVYDAVPMMGIESSAGFGSTTKRSADIGIPVPDVAPSDREDRIVIRDTDLSLQVKSVEETAKGIQAEAERLGGYLVNSFVNAPEGPGSGYVAVRVPTDKLDEALNNFRGLAVKVVSESVNGRDVTDEYEDLEEKLRIYERNKTTFERLMGEAVRVQDMLDIQQKILDQQNQIDSIKGRQQFLEQSAKFSRVTVNLSTDELALPYAPDQAWRPAVVFKLAVRSLVGTLRGLGNMVIWVAVFSVIWLPVALILWFVWRRKRRQTPIV